MRKYIFSYLTLIYVFILSYYMTVGSLDLPVDDKLAHFGAFFVLGILVALTLNSFKIDSSGICIGFLLMIAIGLEIVQMLIPSRVFSVVDGVINIVSVSLGFMVVEIYKRYYTKDSKH